MYIAFFKYIHMDINYGTTELIRGGWHYYLKIPTHPKAACDPPWQLLPKIIALPFRRFDNE